ncbi:MAG: FAD-dependent oxidoreductase [Candidatus Gastranaerophilales bacterium]|nr:FAD-dependent oxidoreductase [Candidatus Gastranaerophilales bacterium]
MNENKVDVIVVGAGPAGVSAGITLARAGKKVVIIERGDFAGSKNMFGGAIYARPTAEIFPNFWETAPVERNNVEHKYVVMSGSDATTISYKHKEQDAYNSFTVIRAKWDRWCINEAKKAGAYFAPRTVVRDLIKRSGRVIGVKTDLESFYSDIVILADGVNSLLAKKAGLRSDIKDNAVALGIKEVIKLPKNILEERFNLDSDTGSVSELIGGPLSGMLGLGYLYTNKESVVIGLGVTLDELKKRKLKPYDLLNELKLHPAIEPFIKGGELLEYSAHLIPEGGYNSIPKLYTDGLMVAGDAGMLVNNVHWEGTNLALVSGKLAAETAIEALEAHDFSENMLALYQEKLDSSFIMKDLKSYKDIIGIVHSNSKSFLGYYPEQINAFFHTFTNVDSMPKKENFRRFIKNFIKNRKISDLFKDACDALKMGIGVLK